MREGKLITLEGIDGSGKSTQVAFIIHWLSNNGYCIVADKEPTNGRWGRELKRLSIKGELTPEKELELFMLDRREHVKNVIMPNLLQGKVILLDRYYHSSMAYQGALDGFDMWEIKEMNEEFAPVPDLTLILDILPTESFFRLQRRGKARTYWENQSLLRKVWGNYHKMNGKLNYVKMVDAWENEKVVFKRIEEHIKEIW